MAQKTINNGDSGLICRNNINDNFTELYAAGIFPEYYITESGGTQMRIGTRANQGVMDLTDTPTGFDGVENVDWHNIFKQS